MYLTRLKALLTDAVVQTFDVDYLVPQFRNLHASIEFPDDRQHYPGVWVDYEPVGTLQRAGVDHFEFDTNFGAGRRYTRWRFQGYATYTLVAMSSLERDLLHDEMIRVLAFGAESPSTSIFRTYMEDNELLDLNVKYDEIGVRLQAASPGTPWGTDEIIYEVTLTVEILGEFVSDSVSATLVPLTKVVVTELAPADVDPDPSW